MSPRWRVFSAEVSANGSGEHGCAEIGNDKLLSRSRQIITTGIGALRAIPCMNDVGFALPRNLNKTVLVVVQEPIVRELIAVNLRSAGFHPVPAESRSAGQQLISQVLPDAVVLDLDAPETGGMSLASEVKAFGNGRHIPIMMLTGQQAKERCRLRCQQPLQANEDPSQLAQLGALVLHAATKQTVFDAVDLQCRLAHDPHQHVTLVVHQVVQQCD
jgi:CheY-like chemotaxis protein